MGRPRTTIQLSCGLCNFKQCYSTFLGPRFKCHKTRKTQFSESEDSLKTASCSRDSAQSASSQPSITTTGPSSVAEQLSTETHPTEPLPAKRLKGLAAVLKYTSEEKETTSAQPTQTPVEKIDRDITSYLNIPVASSETDPLAWRRVEHERFATLARKYLRICGTSVPSEKGLQPAGNVYSDSRN